MSKSRHFIGQPSYSQLLKFIDRQKISQIVRKGGYDRYTKRLDSYCHLVTMLFAVLQRYDSLREVVAGLLSNSNKLSHLGISYCIRRSTFADANRRRNSKFFEQVYYSLYTRYASFLSDSRTRKNLYIMDSTTISLFSSILKGAGRNPKQGKKKGGIKAHTIIKADTNVPQLVRFTSAATHDHVLLKYVNLPKGSIITFDKGYVDYAQYERLSKSDISYVTKLKSNALFEGVEELDIPDTADNGILKDEIIILRKGDIEHQSRRIAYWDESKDKLLVFLTNNVELSAEDIIEIYRRRWQIETLFKQLKQNFPLKYFFGDNVNAIEIQIWVTMIANLLITLVQRSIKRPWAFSNIATTIRVILMSYIDIFSFFEDPEKDWLLTIENREKEPQLELLFR